eukprot:IDg22237t1
MPNKLVDLLLLDYCSAIEHRFLLVVSDAILIPSSSYGSPTTLEICYATRLPCLPYTAPTVSKTKTIMRFLRIHEYIQDYELQNLVSCCSSHTAFAALHLGKDSSTPFQLVRNSRLEV